MGKELDIDYMIKGKIPASSYRPNIIAFSIDSLNEESRSYRLEYFKGDTFLFQFRIPPFQRALKWSVEQDIAFCESVYKGYNLGSYTVNKCEWVGKGLNAHPHPYDMWLIDGLQRLTALKRYYSDEFKVFGYLWSELDDIDHRRFKMASFPMAQISMYDLDELKRLYNALNYGGTPHTEEERAV